MILSLLFPGTIHSPSAPPSQVCAGLDDQVQNLSYNHALRLSVQPLSPPQYDQLEAVNGQGTPGATDAGGAVRLQDDLQSVFTSNTPYTLTSHATLVHSSL